MEIKFHKVALSLMLTVMVLCIMSCSTDGCLDNGSGLPLAAFYDTATGGEVTVTGLTVRGVGAPNDSAIISNTAAHQVYLPLRLDQNVTQYVFDYNVETVVPDTVTITADAVPVFDSEDCGAMFHFKFGDLTATHHAIDSVALVTPLVTNVNTVAIKVFFTAQ